MRTLMHRYADVLIWWFGWVLKLPPWVARFILRLPFVPCLANFLARRLPRWPVRRNYKIECNYEGCEIYA